MEELLELLNDEGERTGVFKPRSVIHSTGEWHLSVHVWLMCKDKILLQKRASTKESYAGLYDASAAGHVSGRESCEETAIRETHEELGVKIDENLLTYVGCRKLRIKQGSFISNEFNYIYLAKCPLESCEIHFDSDEIDCVRWVDFKQLKEEFETDNKLFCLDYEEIAMLEKFLKTQAT